MACALPAAHDRPTLPGRDAFGWATVARPSAAASGLTARMRRDEALASDMAAAQGGDAEAYRRLLRDCLPVIAGLARAQGVRADAVDDVVQDVLLTIHRARATYDPTRPFLPWLRAITQRRAIDGLRRAGRRPREVHDPIAYEAEVDRGPAPSHRLEARERERVLAQAVAALPEGQRQAVEHLALQERSLDETAALTGRSKGALKVNLHRALKALRRTLGADPTDRDEAASRPGERGPHDV